MDIYKAPVVKEPVYCLRNDAPYSENCLECISPRAQMLNRPQKLKRMLFLLEGIVGCARTDYFDLIGVYLKWLLCLGREYELALDIYGTSGIYILQQILREFVAVVYNLNRLKTGTVCYLYKTNGLALPLRLDPT